MRRRMTKITPPTNCPSCGSVLEWRKHLLYCTNPSCGTKLERKIEHFAKTLKIKGLGPASIAKIGLTDITELYLHTKDSLSDALNSNKLAEKLFYEIENSKKAPLNMVLPAFSIPLIGKSAAEKLSTVCDSIYDIDETTCKQAGLGPVATSKLLGWLETEFPAYKGLPFSFTFNRKAKPDVVKGIVCISGKLKSCKTKAEATKLLVESGYEVKSSITKDVTILLNESGIESAKTKKARESGVDIVTNIYDLIGD